MRHGGYKKIIIGLVVLFSTFVPVFSVKAADGCCLRYKDEGQTLELCRPEAGTPCDIEDKYKVSTFVASACGVAALNAGTIVGLATLSGPYGFLVGGVWANDRCRQAFGDPFRIEEPVSCTSKQMCIIALEKATNCSDFKDVVSCPATNCFWSGHCLNRYSSASCVDLPKELCGTPRGAADTACKWNDSVRPAQCLSAVESALSARYTDHSEGLLPACAYAGTCRDVNDLLVTALRVVKKIFGYVGAFAFLFFVYGGVAMITSFGNADRVTKGKEALIAATVGLVITFGAYLLISFLLTTLGVDPAFRPGKL